MKRAPMLFFNIGWMRSYEGIGKADSIVGGGRYVARNEFGHEVFNFLPWRGRVYGFVGRSFGPRLALERLGALPSAERLDGVTVVWVAHRPEGGTVVVGWYRNATVFREMTPFPSGMPKGRRFEWGLSAVARARDAMLIPPEQRWFSIPRATPERPGGIGQANVWYADRVRNEPWYRQLEKAIAHGQVPLRWGRSLPPRARGGRHMLDPERRLAVEKAAVKAVSKHYEGLGFTVESVEEERCGWDLTASSDQHELRVEVKGTSGSLIVGELTPNEYALLARREPGYRLAVVTRALARPTAHVFAFDPVAGHWTTDAGRVLKVTERVACGVSELIKE